MKANTDFSFLQHKHNLTFTQKYAVIFYIQMNIQRKKQTTIEVVLLMRLFAGTTTTIPSNIQAKKEEGKARFGIFIMIRKHSCESCGLIHNQHFLGDTQKPIFPRWYLTISMNSVMYNNQQSLDYTQQSTFTRWYKTTKISW